MSTFSEKFEVAGENLVATVKKLMSDASVRRIIVRNQQGRQLISIPLTFGIAGGALAIFMAPFISALAAIGAAMARVKLEIIRDNTPKS